MSERPHSSIGSRDPSERLLRTAGSGSLDARDTHPDIDLKPPITLEALDLLKGDSRPAAGNAERVAILVCHGMGQQVRFETLMDVARALERAPDARLVGPVVARPVRIRKKRECQDLHRAELVLEKPNEGRREVHLYEAYWAPLTAGKVNVRDVISFLTSGALDSWFHARGPTFRRWMFGRPIELAIKATTTRRKLVGVLLVVLGLVATNFVIGVIGSSRLIRGGHDGWPSDRVLVLLAKELAVLVVLLLIAGFSIWHIQQKRATRPPEKPSGALIAATWASIWLALIGTVAFPLAMLVELALPIARTSSARPLSPWEWVGIVALWAALVALSRRVRFFLIEYLGDVVAYVSSHAVSKFCEVREAIQKASYAIGQALYTALHQGGDAFEYGRIIVVGHSLGSVVAYDTLNAVIREDRTSGGRSQAVARTRMLVTFGSPLNKTAFIFRTQMPEGAELREALAAAVQPMIQSYDLRPREWINLHSKADWISGPIQFYDDPLDRDPAHAWKKVQDRPDPDAMTPLAAHTEYWNNPKLGECLVAGIFN